MHVTVSMNDVPTHPKHDTFNNVNNVSRVFTWGHMYAQCKCTGGTYYFCLKWMLSGMVEPGIKKTLD